MVLDMIVKVVLIVLAVIGIFFLVKFLLTNYKFKFDNFTFFQGSLGSGKTSILTYFAVKLYKKRHRYNKFIYPVVSILLWIFVPTMLLRLFGKLHYDKLSEEVYSNYPILLNKRKKLYSRVVNTEVLTWIFKMNDSSILVLDEVGYLLPNVINGKAVLSDSELRLCLTYLRHATNCTCLMASQSLSEVNKTMRAKINHCYNLSGVKVRKFLKFLPSSVHVFETIVSEDVDTVYSDSTKDYRDNVFRFWFPYNRFASRYAKNMYYLERQDIQILSQKFDLLLKQMGLYSGDTWKSLYYEFN